MAIELRDYQREAIEKTRHAVSRGHRNILLVGPTACGKTVIAAEFFRCATVKGSYGMFLADQRELVGQCADDLVEMGVDYGTIMAGADEYEAARAEQDNIPIRVIAKATLWQRAVRTRKIKLPPADVIIIDEAHRSLSRTYRTLMKRYPNAVKLGLTATPCRGDGRGLGEYWDEMVIVAGYHELQRGGYLMPVEVIAPEKRKELDGVKTKRSGDNRGDYDDAELEKVMRRQDLVGEVVRDWRKNATGLASIVFACSIGHSIDLRNKFREQGFRAEHIDGATEKTKRKRILEDLAHGKLDVVTNFGVLTTGVDFPHLGCIVIARPTKSFGLYRQMAGRVMRAPEGKDRALIIDHGGCVYEFGYPDEDVPWTLNPQEKIQVRVQKSRKSNGQKKVWHCPDCDFAYKGPQCPKCGWKRTVQPEEIHFEQGDLFEVDREKARRRRKTPMEAKQAYWDQCLGWAIGRGLPVSQASCRYKSKFGTWPPHELNFTPRGRTQMTMNAKRFYDQHVVPEKERLKANGTPKPDGVTQEVA